ncbi:PLC-like phosphodiesterase [Colletotrichum sojae]|uniref:PLC-like phosphodiesterase n=1 Tax=Colletotrichum sojae TaxID=2175907 RepID=A0A8H6IU09_9PEZI|nr:PLC-like phosphodiesterase [Colletotrichum sojae]
MNDWSLPEKVKPGELATAYAEFRTATTRDWGRTQYSFGFHFPAFEVGINGSDRGTGDYYLHLLDVSALDNPRGTRITTPFVHNGSAFLFRGGSEADALGFVSSNPPGGDWMRLLLPSIGRLTLREVCLLEAHDAGMSIAELGTRTSAVVTLENVRTQTLDVGAQLRSGARYLDVRPVVSGGRYFTGHYSDTRSVLGWQGANGESIAEIVREVNEFTAEHAELVVVDLSHAIDTDSGYRGFDQAQWDRLFAALRDPETGLRGLFEAPAGTTDLTTLRMEEFIGRGSAAVVCVVQAGDHIAIPEGRGLYRKRMFFPVNPPVAYSNTDRLDVMTADQLRKMRLFKTRRKDPVLETSWTLTQVTPAEAAGLGPSILRLAARARNELFEKLWGFCEGESFPNIIELDNIDATDYLALALAITLWFRVGEEARRR